MAQTADQARQLADLFSKMSGTVDDYRAQHFEELAPEERLRLQQLFQQLCDLHDQFTALAIENTLSAIASDLDHIVSVTGEAQRSLQHLQTIAEITNLVSAAAELGADISTADYGAIPHAITNIIHALPKKPARQPPVAN
jgi:hypothetical protein